MSKQDDDIFIKDFSHIYDHFIEIYNNFDQEQSDFQAKIAHEVKNPLTIIKSMLQLVEKSVPQVKETSYWSSIFNEIEYMNELLNDLTYYSRSIQVEKQPMNLNDLIQEVKGVYTPYATEQNKTFYVDFPPEMPILEADPIKIKQVIINLLKNAFEATDVNGKIILNSYYQDNCIMIEVQDNGKGIPSEHLNSIFDPFITYKSNGTGLGLSIVKNIIKEHNGTIHVASKPDQGTSFLIKIPVPTDLHTAI